MNARLVKPPGDPVCAAGPLGTSSVLRALSMQVWPAASSGWPTAWLGPADLDSAGFSAVGRSSWVFGREPYFAKYSSLVAQREKLRGSIGSSLAVFFAGPLVQ